MVSVKIDLKKKDFVWISLVIVLIGVGLVIGYGGGQPGIHGHDVNEIANAGAGGGMSFGTLVDVTASASGGSPQPAATTDGIVLAYHNNVGPVRGYTPDSTLVLRDGDGDTGGGYGATITMPVKKGNTWKVTSGQAGMLVYWMPIISGGDTSSSQRTVYGELTSAGAKAAGEGFTSSRPSSGHYSVVFDEAYPSKPAVTVTPFGSAPASNANIILETVTTTGFTFYSGNTHSGGAQNLAMSFIVVGPQ